MPLPGKPEADVTARELAMAEQLIDGMMTDWQPTKFKDRFYRDVMKLIEEKAPDGDRISLWRVKFPGDPQGTSHPH